MVLVSDGTWVQRVSGSKKGMCQAHWRDIEAPVMVARDR